MSLTSCFKYAVELPEATLTSLVRTVVSQGETAGVPTTFEQDGVPIEGYTARISASLVDSAERPSTVDLTAVENRVVLGLHMDVSVTLEEVEGLDSVDYEVDFQLPGTIARNDTTTPPQIEVTFPGLTAPDLAAVVSDAAFGFTAALFEGPIHEIYDATPGLHGYTEPNVVVPEGEVFVQVWLYDDEPGAPGFHGSISVQLPAPMALAIVIPGRMKMTDVSMATVHDFTFDVTVNVDLVIEPNVSGGEDLVVDLGSVVATDVSVAYGATAPFYAALAITPRIQAKVVGILSTMTEPRQTIPTRAQVRERVEAALLTYASSLVLPLLPLSPTAGTSVSLTGTVPTTIGGVVLALQIEQDLTTPCDGAEDFTGGNPVAIGMSAAEVQRRLDEATAGIEGTEVEVEGYDVTLNRPSAWLEDPGEHGEAEGHIWIEGTAVVHVGGCVGDVDADYYGPVMLDPVMRSDGSVGFQIRAGTFGGDADVKDKKDDFDPDTVASFIEGWNFDFPTIPSTFDGVAELTLQITTALVSRKGIVLTGSVGVQSLQSLMWSTALPISTFWSHESAGGG